MKLIVQSVLQRVRIQHYIKTLWSFFPFCNRFSLYDYHYPITGSKSNQSDAGWENLAFFLVLFSVSCVYYIFHEAHYLRAGLEHRGHQRSITQVAFSMK